MSTSKRGKSAKSVGHSSKSRRTRPTSALAKPASDGHEIEFIARGVLLQGTRVLLCQNLKHGYLYLPGGHVEFGESAAAAVAREFLEECGVAVHAGELALASEGSFATKKRLHHEVNLVFHVEHAGKKLPRTIKSKEDGIGFAWVDLAAVPEMDIRPLAVKAFLATLGSDRRGVEWVSEIAQPGS